MPHTVRQALWIDSKQPGVARKQSEALDVRVEAQAVCRGIEDGRQQEEQLDELLALRRARQFVGRSLRLGGLQGRRELRNVGDEGSEFGQEVQRLRI
jgi:hypothetical protein